MWRTASREFPWLQADDPAIQDIARTFNEFGSDKASEHHYERLYASILADLNWRPDAILEVGIGTNKPGAPSSMGLQGTPGASLRAWREILPSTQVIGADVDRDILINEDRITSYYVDQLDPNSLHALALQVSSNYPAGVPLVIDDGLHTPHAALNTAKALAPVVSLGGYLVIEDVNVHTNAALLAGLEELGSQFDLLQLDLRASAPRVDSTVIILRRFSA